MAKLTDDGRVISDDGQWQWDPQGGSIKGGSWERIAPMTTKPSLATRLLVKKSAWGKPGLGETMQADKLQPSAANQKLGELEQKMRDKADQT